MIEQRPAQEMIANKPTIEARVKLILEQVPQTKGDDVLLIYHYLRRHSQVKLSFHQFKDLFFCVAFESITRARRRIQKLNPNLKPTKRVIHKRDNLEAANRAYYRPLGEF